MNAHLPASLSRNSVRFRTLSVALLTLVVGAGTLLAQTPVPDQASSDRIHAKSELLRQPLGFEPNHGQAGAGVDFVSRGRGYSLLLSGSESTFVTAGDASDLKERSIHMQLVGANAAVKPSAEKPLPGRSNYLFGNDPSRWVHGVQQFEQVRLANAYPGIDLLYYGNQKQVEHDFIVSPGTDPAQIRMEFSGAASQTIARSGALELKTPSGATVALEKPVAYQMLASGARHTVTADYATLSDNNVGFRVGTYDHSLPLVIDPIVITYSTYIGGNNQDSVVDLKLDAAGNIYVLMTTDSTDLPVVSQIAGACVGTCGPKNPDTLTNSLNYPSHDFYLAKLDPTGQTLLFGTYIGGSKEDTPGALSLPGDGSIYIAGATRSPDFPVVNQYSSALAPPGYGGISILTSTLTRLSADGSTILYSSLIGGGLVNFATGAGGRYWGTSAGTIAAGPNGIVYLLGYAESNDEGGGFGTFVDAKGTSFLNSDGTFLAKFDTTKTGYDSLVYATTFGQPGDSGAENLWAVALDSKQNVWVFGTGGYGSPPIPTANAVQPICGGGGQCDNTFLFELNPTGVITYATFLGGTVNAGGGPGIESALNMYIDPSDNIYLTGGTESTDFPTKNGAAPTAAGGSGFLTKLSPGALSILYSTYTPFALYMTGTPSGIAGLVGASGGGFPVKNGITRSNLGPTSDTVFQMYDTTQTGDASLLASSYLGSTFYTIGQVGAFDASGQLLFGGYTESGTLPLVNPYQSTCSGGCYYAGNYYPDGFISRVQLNGATGGTVAMVPTTQTFPSTAVGATSAALTSTLTNNGASAFVFTPSFTDSTDFKETDTCNGMVAAGANCTFSFTFSPQATGSLTSTFTLTGATTPATTLTVALSGTATGSPVLTISPSTYAFGSVASGANPVTQTLVLKNTGNVADNALTFNFNETDQGGQTPSLTYGAPCTSLAVGATCNIVITFTPHAGVTATGTLTVNGDAGVTPAVATITGTGTAPAAATLSTTSYSFGSVTDGTTTPATTFTLSNTGGSSLTVSSITISGAGAAAFAVVPGSNCTTAFAANAACTFSVTFSPTAATSYAATVNVADQAGTQMLALTGTGTAAVQPTLTPSSLAFGSVVVGQTSAPQLLTLNNLTNSTIAALSSITTPPQFGLSNTGSCGNTLAAGATCTLAVIYQPTTSGPTTGTLIVGTGATTTTAALSGTGTPAPAPSFTPASLNFGTVPIGTHSATQTLTLNNPTASPITLSTLQVPGTFSTNSFCGTTLAAGANCTIQVFFAPAALGAVSGNLTLSFGTGSATAALTGIGGTAVPLTFTPSSVTFPSTPIGTYSASQTLTVTNPTSGTVALGPITIQNPAQGGTFPYDNHCGATLASGATCTIDVLFGPKVIGPASGSISIFYASAAGDITSTAALSGTAVAAIPLQLTPSSVTFASTPIGTFSASQTLTVTNATGGGVSLNAITVQNPAQGGTFPYDNHCAATLANGASCTIDVLFGPTALGPLSGSLTVSYTAPSGNVSSTATLTGTGGAAPPPMSFSPASFDFGSVFINAFSTPQTFTYTNTTASTLTLGTPTTQAPFAVANHCGTTLAVGASCYVAVIFGPTSVGAASGTVSMNTSNGSVVASLTGIGVSNDFSITASPSSQDVNGGDVAIYKLTIGPAGGSAFEQVVSLSASGLPAGATVVFSNPTVFPQAAPVLSFMDVVTTAGHAQNTRPPLWPLTAPISAAVLMLFPWVRRRRAITSLLGVLLLMGMSGAVMGCGVNAASTAASGPTTITVTATSGSLVHSTTVTLTIH